MPASNATHEAAMNALEGFVSVTRFSMNFVSMTLLDLGVGGWLTLFFGWCSDRRVAPSVKQK
jgi:hypothetical protein